MVSNVSTTLPINELLTLPIASLALKLRSELSSMTPEKVSALHAHHAVLQSSGRKPHLIFPSAFAFLNSSWRCSWEDAAFEGIAPTRYDQGCQVPIVSVFINRPGKDGIDIYFTGTKDGCVHFNGLMQASLLNPTPNKN